MPGRDKAADWVRKARLYVAAREALDTIETAALLEPQRRRPAPALRPGRGPAPRAARGARQPAQPARPALRPQRPGGAGRRGSG